MDYSFEIWCKENNNFGLLDEWHMQLNDILPSEVSHGSNQKIWWLGKCGHEWQATINNRKNGSNCPFCSGRKLLVGYNDLATTNPELAKEWHPTKNGDLYTDMVTRGSHKKVWWLCSKGHEWETKVNDRNTGTGCPYCSGKNVWRGFNDLLTVNPELAKEWHPTKNEKLMPYMVTLNSAKKVWWMCSKGHEWQTTVNGRGSSGSGCPVCSGNKIEIDYNDLSTTNPELTKEWHPTKNGELTPQMVTKGSNRKVWWLGSCGHEWKTAVITRSSGNGCPICRNLQFLAGYNDLTTAKPELAKEWHPTKNGQLSPKQIGYYSKQKVWWRCSEGHEWQAKVCDRNNGRGCPICSNRKLLLGYNDLGTTNPELAKEWHPTKNNKLTPQMVMTFSSQKVWWLGKCGHEWQATIANRSSANTGCPICNKEFRTSFAEQAIYYYINKMFPDAENGNRSILDGRELDIYIPSRKVAIEYDGANWHKDIYKDINKNVMCEEKNIFLYRVRESACPLMESSSNTKVLICDNEKDLSSIICRICLELSNKEIDVNFERDMIDIHSQYIASIKEKSLESVNPQLSKEWHPTKNGSLKPETVTANTNKRIWWICSKGHEWQSTVITRNSGSGCPICSNHKVLEGYNDLETINPELAKEWHPIKNGEITPKMFTTFSGKKVWWLGRCGHEWQANISTRSEGIGCPYCRNLYALEGYNDLVTTNPELAKEWHPTKNGELTPQMVTKGSNKKVWWLGKCGHTYQAIISNRNTGSGCSVCAGRMVQVGVNDLATTSPELLVEWHPTKNGNLTPEMLTKSSQKKVWWLCSEGHEWQASPATRQRCGCKKCKYHQNGKKQSKKVRNIDTGEIFGSIHEAEESCGVVGRGNIGACCRKKQKTSCGYRWEFVNED